MFLSKKVLSLNDKISIIRSFEALKDIDVTKEFTLPRATVNSLWARRKGILEIFESNEVTRSGKQFREFKHPELGSGLLLWFKKVRDGNNISQSH